MDGQIVVKVKQEGAKDSKEEEVQDEAFPEERKDLPRKEDDPSLVVLHVSIDNMEIGNSLNDLGASVSIL